MIESAKIPDLLTLFIDETTLETIDNDPMLSITRYKVSESMRGGSYTELCIATNSKQLFSPKEKHQLLAKGVVYEKISAKYPGVDPSYELVAFPYTKIYNSFEGPAVNDADSMKYRSEPMTTQLVRKLDGTLIARWVYEGEVYFSTRGRIISIEKNDFYDLTMKVIKKKGYDILLDPEYASGATIIMELIGPSNVILEVHPEDDLVVTGVYSRYHNKYVDPTKASIKDSGLNIAEVYDAASPEEVIAAFNTIQEGVIKNWYMYDENGEPYVICRIKYKSEDYINLLKASNRASKESLLDLILANNFSTWDEIENHFVTNMADHPYREELLNIYKEEWLELYPCLVSSYGLANTLMESALVGAKIENRKERFFFFRDTTEKYAGFMMGIIDGKKTERDLVNLIARETCGS